MAATSWTSENLALLGKMPDDELACRVGCTVHVVREMRCRRGIKYCGQFWKHCAWSQRELKLFDRYTDVEVAKATGRAVAEVAAKRLELGVRADASNVKRPALAGDVTQAIYYLPPRAEQAPPLHT